jgi:NAD(P)-dependent dehydrogenase (short-subunit alcohol dehydrogenase family)
MSLVRLSTNPGPVGRVGTPEDVAQAFLAVMRNPFVTATVLHVDGGQRLV